MRNELFFSDTIQQKEILENLLIEFNKFSSIDTNFWAWCNANEGVIAFWSVIASFLVSMIAISLSVYTFRSQKILQTKNIQENARLQRKLTEQNNKLQVDLKIRQIKLDSFNLRYECWNILQFLENLFSLYTKRISLYKGNYNKLWVGELLEINDTFKKIYRIKDVRLLLKLKFILKDKKELLGNVVDECEIIETTLILYSEKNEYLPDVINFIEEKIKIIDKIKILIEDVEKDLDISNLDKIINNS